MDIQGHGEEEIVEDGEEMAEDEFSDGGQGEAAESDEFSDGDQGEAVESDDFTDGDQGEAAESDEFSDGDQATESEFSDGDEWTESDEFSDGDEGEVTESDDFYKDEYWLVNVIDLHQEKRLPIFIQSLWNAAVAQAELRVRAHRQLCIEDVPRFRIYVDAITEKLFLNLMLKVFRRMREVRSMSVGGTPTTPPEIEGFETFRIIEFAKIVSGKLHIVQTLHRESNLYFGAFQKMIAGSVVKPGWLIFDKKELPKWIVGVKIPYSEAHGQIHGVVLGKFWWEDIFHNLFNCTEDSKQDKAVSRVIKRGILLVCEPQRIRTCQKRVVRTLKDETLEEIEEEDEIHSWGYLSREGFKFELAELTKEKPEPKPEGHYAETIRKKITTKWELCGAHGEIMILKYDEDHVIPIIMKRQEELASKAANWKPENHVLNQIRILLEGKSDNMIDQALASIHAQYGNLQDFHKYLTYILVHKQIQSGQQSVKQYAGLILEKELRVAFWDISPSCVHYMKTELILCIGTSNKEIRSTARNVIAALFQRIHVACWMELFQELHECMDSKDFDRNEGSMEVLLKISENGAEHLDDDVLGLHVRPINVFMPLLVQFMKSQHASLRKLALGCISHYVALLPSSLCEQMDQYIEYLLDLFEDPSVHVKEKVCLAWVQIVGVHPSTLEKKLVLMGDEVEKHRKAAVSSIVAIVEGHIMRSNFSQILAFLVVPLDDQFPIICSTICQTILGCSKSIIQDLGHPKGRDIFVDILMGLLFKTSHKDARVRNAAIFALEALEEEVEIQEVETEARQALVHYIELHGAEGWELLMAALEPAI